MNQWAIYLKTIDLFSLYVHTFQGIDAKIQCVPLITSSNVPMFVLANLSPPYQSCGAPGIERTASAIAKLATPYEKENQL